MSYLFDKVNLSLLERIAEMAPETDRWLQLDFADSSLELPGDVVRISLVDPDGDRALAGHSATSFDAAVINLQLAWLEPGATIQSVNRVLKPGGHLFFTTFGPDTLFELREGWDAVDDQPHVHPFMDMHHLGDLLLRSGLKRPIVDSDWMGVHYDDVDLLMSDLRAAGFHNILSDRRKTLTGTGRLEKLRSAFSQRPHPIGVTWEIVYGYAQLPVRSDRDGIRVSFSGA